MSNCNDCYSVNPNYFPLADFISTSCSDCSTGGCYSIANFCYQGPNLDCSGIVTGDTLEAAFQKIDEQICSAVGDYSTYQFNCLTAWWGSDITTEAQFVDAITSYACEITSNLESFTGTTFPAYQSEIEAQLDDISGPGLVCAAAGVTIADSLNTLLTKYCTLFGTIQDAIDLTDVDWQQCFTVLTTPTTVAEGFDLLIGQICELKDIAEGAATLPTFNNLTSCLATPGAADTLVQTIEKIKDRLCLTGEFDPDTIVWGCLSTQTDLQDTIQEIVTTVSDNQKLLITAVSADFVLSATDAMDDCAGLTLELATPLVNSDRLVASNDADLDPGTLIDKLTAGDNITIDDTTTPGQIIITADQTNKVAANGLDTTPDYLVNKLTGDSEVGITLAPGINGTNDGVVLDLSVNLDTLATALLAAIQANGTNLATFCAMVANCITDDCGSISYTITNETGIDQSVTWSECGNILPITIVLAPASVLTVCAVPDSVEAGDCLVSAGDSCDPSTTTTTTTTSTTTTTTSTTTTTGAP